MRTCTNNENEIFRLADKEYVEGKTFCCAKDGCNWDAVTGILLSSEIIQEFWKYFLLYILEYC